MEFRKDFYPPFLKLAKITFSHSNGLKIKDEMDSYVQILKANKDIEVVGFGQSPIFKMANKYRYEILVRSKQYKSTFECFTLYFKSKCLNRYGYYLLKIKLILVLIIVQ